MQWVMVYRIVALKYDGVKLPTENRLLRTQFLFDCTTAQSDYPPNKVLKKVIRLRQVLECGAAAADG